MIHCLILIADDTLHISFRYYPIPLMQKPLEWSKLDESTEVLDGNNNAFHNLLHFWIDVDMANQRFIGKETKRDIKAGDRVRVRIVSLNLNSSTLEDSKIGFTMKQSGLGKLEWLARKIEN